MAATTDELISEFNEGKEVDLDRLTAGTGSVDLGVERNSQPADTKVTAAHANVCNWLLTQNDSVGLSSERTGSSGTSGRYHPVVDVHHL